ncbi:ferrochelatase [Pelagibaculum spongiae]|uniref:Ferrochelatase n=1 Tax=Pelagibaculum spongiae TaxID=2080658 RepID=A0A2V1H5R0_9GAMM|nr:ferrochelatase [Pelagibaculum spongiae]PVZ71762.1 ferrochelatase [Pelagibaculum spongiae]
MQFTGQTEYDHENSSLKKGVLLCNLGTPDAPTPKALRTYLRQFLSDYRVIGIPKLLWWVILNLVILPFRPKSSAKLYQQVWTDQGSPLLVTAKAQQKKLQQRFDQQFGEGQVPVALGMRYGNPSIESAIQQLTDQNVRDIVVLPLYPQYCAATAGSTWDALADTLKKYRWVPSVRFINGYHTTDGYLTALAASIQQQIDKTGMPDKIILSFHGTPESYLKQGDPYHCFCHQTTRLVTERLGLEKDQVMTTFQSRFGKAAWLQPYTDKTLQALPEQGVKNILIACPGFSADCLETIEEIDAEGRETFMHAGGEQFHYIPALNDRDDHIDGLYDLVTKNFS